MGTVDRLGKGEQQPRHQEEHRHHTEYDGLCQNNTHIIADPKLHEHHGNHAGDCRQGARGNFRDCLAQRHNHRLPRILVLVLLHETVCQNNRIIHRQTELQDNCNGVRHKADCSEPVVCSFI